jgi:translation initiation factor 4A
VISRNREFEGDGLNISNTVFDNNNADGVTVPNNTGDNVDRCSSDDATNANNVDNNDIEYTPKEFDKWEDLEGIINEDIMRGIYAYGFDTPSLIQQKALLTMFDKKDIIAQAQSGTGKTGVFTIGALQNVNPKLNKTQAMILAPTRELAKQIHGVISGIGVINKDIRYHVLIGGTSTDEDAFQLKSVVPHIIIGCPGRVYDMMRRNNIVAKDINMLILDEADEMLSIGFKDQIYNIFQFLNSNVQVGLFSATLPNELQALTDKFMRNPVRILVKSELLTLEGIKQYHVALNDDSQKYATLKDIFNIISMSQCIIYCNSIKRVIDLTEAMINDGFPVCCIHSNMDKIKRDESYMEFKAGKHRVLISSNVTSRGIDVQNVRTVLNFDLPKCMYNYLHRIGRSGRWGRKGTAINFVTRWDVKTMKDIERHYHTIIEELPSNIIID